MARAIFSALIMAAGLFAASGANAEEVGSLAYVIHATELQTGPGARYPLEGTTLTEGEEVTVVRCSDRWCRIAGTQGWMSEDHLSFGNLPEYWFEGPKLDHVLRGDGEVCFHEGAHYSGDTVCLGSGAVARDLALLGWDNRVSSISIEGEASVNVCRDADFHSFCELVVESQPNVHRLLDNAISAWQVW